MRGWAQSVLFSLVLGTFVNSVESGWCTRVICTSVRIQECVYRTWQGCCLYRWVWKVVVRTERYCCTGYKGNNCDIPICNPECQNGGTCTAPGECECASGFNGTDCTGDVPCSSLFPCYPGFCIRFGNCNCKEGFTSDTCLQLSGQSQVPQVWQSRVRLSRLKVSTDQSLNGMLMYDMITDSSSPNNSNVEDTIWSNQKGFNHLELMGAAQFDPQDLYPKPPYVLQAEFGITSAVVKVQHTKIQTSDGQRYIASNKTYPCTEENNKDVAPYWNCTHENDKFKESINNADELKFTFTFKSGGYRRLNNQVKQSYLELRAEKKMKFLFDLELPVHCRDRDNTNCPQPLQVEQEITRQPVVIHWDGWNDTLSGMHRYAWEIFRLEPYTAAGELREPEPLKPLINTEWFVSNGSVPVTYTPPGPGLYSVILEASDLANNSRYARRLFLYDNVSRITVVDTTDTRLYVSSAADNTSNQWQSDLTNDIVVNWSGHFINLIHHQNKLLNAVLEYPPQFTDIKDVGAFTQKSIDYDDKEGNRTLNAIPNVRGIIKFEVGYDSDHSGGTTLNEPTSWTEVGNMAEAHTISGKSRTKGESVRVWVRATDIMGNEMVDHTTVSFDTTSPNFILHALQRNMKGGNYSYSSRVNLTVSDEESGIQSVRWRLSRDNTAEVTQTGQVDLTPYKLTHNECTLRPSECHCTPSNECFISNIAIEINHCWLIETEGGLESEVITMEIDVTNHAMLISRRTFKIGDLHTLEGIRQCPILVSGLSSGAMAGISLSIVLIVVVVVVVVLLWHTGIAAVILRRRHRRPMTKAAVAFSRMSRKVRGVAVDDDIYVYGGAHFDIPIGVQISASRLTLEEIIAEGKFAMIYKACLASGDSEKKTVVAKMLRESHDAEDQKLMTGKILFYLNEVGEHRNILRMIGTVVENELWGPVMVLEYCEIGTMRNWLVSKKGAVSDDVIDQMFHFANGIIQGMAYLAGTGIVHRRLAARNILLTFLLEVRITGFGPTNMEGEDAENEEKSQKERVPIRWMPPECFKSTRDATEKSDVWSFGVVLWEIFSLGDNPYPTLKTNEIPMKVNGGHRMAQPEFADNLNYDTMLRCWEQEAKKRPKFRDLEKYYNKLMTGGGSNHYSYSTNYTLLP